MKRFELIGQIVTHLHNLDDASLQCLLTELEAAAAAAEEEITDETLEAITYGADDTEHLLSSPNNAEDLHRAIEELQGKDLLMPELEHAASWGE